MITCCAYLHWTHPSEKRIKDYFKQPVDWDTYYPQGRSVPKWVIYELQVIADNLLPLFDNMPRVKVVYDPCFWNYPGQYYPDGNLVVIRANCDMITRTLKHEMVHAWIHWVRQDKRIDPHFNMHHNDRVHNETFHLKAFQVGAEGTEFMEIGPYAADFARLNSWLYRKNELAQYLVPDKLRDGKRPELPTPPYSPKVYKPVSPPKELSPNVAVFMLLFFIFCVVSLLYWMDRNL